MQRKRKEERKKPTFPGEYSLKRQLLVVLADISLLQICFLSIQFPSVTIDPSLIFCYFFLVLLQ